MKTKLPTWPAHALAVFALLAACGGEQPPAAQPANPAPSAQAAAPGANQAPSASASPPAPSAAAAPGAGAASGGTTAAGPPPPPGPGEWDKWSKDQKLEYMKAAVMPKMGALFHDFDSTKYAQTKCVLCHGSGVKNGTFTMPNAELPKLPTGPGEFMKVREKAPKMFDFMVHEVEPTMAALVGEKPFDPKTKTGFSCFECHTKK
jgi:hypothetical protein